MHPCKQHIQWADGKTMVKIPAGSGIIGSEKGYRDEQPVHTFTTDGFYMDATPVTNGEYRRFCDATGRAYPPAPPWEGMDGYFTACPDYPVINVTFDDCRAYAAWAGKRLPTEEEWEYAARGGRKQSVFPWGDGQPYERDMARANFADRHSTMPWRDGFSDDGYRYTSPVGRYPANGYGLFDMAGNVYEYVDTWYFSYGDTEKSTAGFDDGWGGSRVCRGGSFHSPARDLRIARRHQILAGGANEAVGFRCVADREQVPEHACAVGLSAAAKKTKPDRFWEQCEVASASGAGTELCAGMNYPLSEERMRQLKHLGFTSVEQYVTWRSCENRGKGQWDFSLWDAEAEKLQKAGLKWLPFIIAGPGYSLPDWYRRSQEHTGLCCAEHGIPSAIQSFWDKRFYGHIDRFLKALSEHYTDPSLFEGLLFGISGDFGEAIVSVWHGNWPTHTCGTYHAHAGYWCADPYAVADFRREMKKKYKQDIAALNAAWQTDFQGFELLAFPDMEVGTERSRIDGYTEEGILTVSKPGDRVRILDFIDWYRASMTRYVEYWMKTARKYFPHTKLYLCTGGEAQPCHGSEFAAQSKVCARYGGGVRITNEDSQFEKNFCITNWVASACTYYGGDFSFEPAGAVTKRGVVCRIYNASATGAKGLHFYGGNVAEPERRAAFRQNIACFTQEKVTREMALFYPDTAIMFRPEARGEMLKTFSAMRDYSDYAFADDLTVQDGILDGCRAVVLTVDGYYRKKTLRRLKQFVKAGGLLVGIGLTRLCCIEDDRDVLAMFFATEGEKVIGRGKTLRIPESLLEERTDEQINERIFDPMTRFLTANGLYISDGKRDRFYTAQKGKGLLVMNYGEREITRTVSLPDGRIQTLSLPPASICNIQEK